MMRAVVSREEDRTRAVVVSFLFHAAILAMLIFWKLASTEPEAEAPAIIVPLEMTPPEDAGWAGGGDNAAPGQPDQGGDNGNNGGEVAGEDTYSPPPPTSEKTAPVSQAPPSNPPKTPTSTDPDAAAIRQRQQQEDQRRREMAAEAERIANEERQRKAAEEARLAAERAQREKVKNAGKDALGKKPGNGPGEKPGPGGAPDGQGTNPNGTRPGSGPGDGPGSVIGGNLGNRKVSRPKMVDNTQKTGKVVVEVCVDGQGNVVSADYTMRGSTTTDSELRSKAITWARQHKFAPSTSAKECGTITFNFLVK